MSYVTNGVFESRVVGEGCDSVFQFLFKEVGTDTIDLKPLLNNFGAIINMFCGSTAHPGFLNYPLNRLESKSILDILGPNQRLFQTLVYGAGREDMKVFISSKTLPPRLAQLIREKRTGELPESYKALLAASPPSPPIPVMLTPSSTGAISPPEEHVTLRMSMLESFLLLLASVLPKMYDQHSMCSSRGSRYTAAGSDHHHRLESRMEPLGNTYLILIKLYLSLLLPTRDAYRTSLLNDARFDVEASAGSSSGLPTSGPSIPDRLQYSQFFLDSLAEFWLHPGASGSMNAEPKDTSYRGIYMFIDHLLRTGLDRFDDEEGTELALAYFKLKRSAYLTVQPLLFLRLESLLAMGQSWYGYQLALRTWAAWLSPWDAVEAEGRAHHEDLAPWDDYLRDNLPFYAPLLRTFLRNTRMLHFSLDTVQNGLEETIPDGPIHHAPQWRLLSQALTLPLRPYSRTSLVDRLTAHEGRLLSLSFSPSAPADIPVVRYSLLTTWSRDVFANREDHVIFSGRDKSLPVDFRAHLRDRLLRLRKERRALDPRGDYAGGPDPSSDEYESMNLIQGIRHYLFGASAADIARVKALLEAEAAVKGLIHTLVQTFHITKADAEDLRRAQGGSMRRKDEWITGREEDPSKLTQAQRSLIKKGVGRCSWEGVRVEGRRHTLETREDEFAFVLCFALVADYVIKATVQQILIQLKADLSKAESLPSLRAWARRVNTVWAILFLALWWASPSAAILALEMILPVYLLLYVYMWWKAPKVKGAEEVEGDEDFYVESGEMARG